MKTCPPNIKKFDVPPTKKAKLAKSAPSTSTLGPLLLEEVTSLDGDLEFGDAPSAPPVGRKVHILKACKTLVQMLSKAVKTERALSSYDILTWMDAENSEVNGLYIDSYGDFQTFEVKDALNIMENRVGVLASFGYLGRGGALRLRQCMRDKVLIPLGLWETIDDSVGTVKKPLDIRRLLGW